MDLAAWTPEDWTALGTIVTALVAMAAAIVGGWQVHIARENRRDVTQPFVFVDFEPSQASEVIYEIVLRNLGQTLARDIRIDFEPPLQTVGPDGHPVDDAVAFIRDPIPVLPPGARMTTVLDSMIERKNAALEDRYTVTVTCRDARNRKIAPFTYVLDLGVHRKRHYVKTYGSHDIAKSTRDIAKILKSWTTHSSGIQVYARDEDRRRRRARDFFRREGRQPTMGDLFDLDPDEFDNS